MELTLQKVQQDGSDMFPENETLWKVVPPKGDPGWVSRRHRGVGAPQSPVSPREAPGERAPSALPGGFP